MGRVTRTPPQPAQHCISSSSNWPPGDEEEGEEEEGDGEEGKRKGRREGKEGESWQYKSDSAWPLPAAGYIASLSSCPLWPSPLLLLHLLPPACLALPRLDFSAPGLAVGGGVDSE